jgi:hypothetical protein
VYAHTSMHTYVHVCTHIRTYVCMYVHFVLFLCTDLCCMCVLFCSGSCGTAFWKGFKAKHDRPDIFLDDGGHTMKQQLNSYNFYFDYVKPDGIYAVEDLHTWYVQLLSELVRHAYHYMLRLGHVVLAVCLKDCHWASFTLAKASLVTYYQVLASSVACSRRFYKVL